MKMSTKRAYWLRYSIEYGQEFAKHPEIMATLNVMEWAKRTVPRRYRKVMVDVYHANR